jgi:ATP-dependent DNA helicase RecG
MAMHFLQNSIEFLKGVGPKRAALIAEELGIKTFGQLLVYFPFRYIDRSKIFRIREVHHNLAAVQVKGSLISFQKTGQGRGSRLVAYLKDDTGIMELVWFQGWQWIIEKLVVGKVYVAFGKPSVFNGRLNIAHPELETFEKFEQSGDKGIQPVYGLTEKLKKNYITTKTLSQMTRELTQRMKGQVEETLPDILLGEMKLLNLEDALLNIHHPVSYPLLHQAVKRLKFEELFHIQLRYAYWKKKRETTSHGLVFSKVGDLFNDFYHNKLPFSLTNAQKEAVRMIRKDMGRGSQMNRLLQGDVGSGKTIVALMGMLIALDNHFQAALMAPTEILAQQHYHTLKKFLDGMPVWVDLLTGATPKSKRTEIDEGLKKGNLHILVGTHALIEEHVKFQNLGLVVIDEQHRFGVAQRARMWKKNHIPPHILVMTATPIPRSLAMTYYGEMDYTIIDELPPGRKPIKTLHFTDAGRLQMFHFIKKEIQKGQQVYVVYPLIEESQKLDLKDLMDGYESFSRAFPLPDYHISIVHGRMSSEAKAAEMKRFVQGQTQIMVSTTVIEVGVDVPNASVMVIENAERFGLSQLHQLRGRVGRGADQSYCLLMTKDKLSGEARIRIGAMLKSNDGFYLARIDLKLRGPGEMMGTMQSGRLQLKLADISEDGEFMELARNKADQILKEDPDLKSPAYIRLRSIVKEGQHRTVSWGDII